MHIYKRDTNKFPLTNASSNALSPLWRMSSESASSLSWATAKHAEDKALIILNFRPLYGRSWPGLLDSGTLFDSRASKAMVNHCEASRLSCCLDNCESPSDPRFVVERNIKRAKAYNFEMMSRYSWKSRGDVTEDDVSKACRRLNIAPVLFPDAQLYRQLKSLGIQWLYISRSSMLTQSALVE